MNFMSGFKLINNLATITLSKCIDYSTMLRKIFVESNTLHAKILDAF